VVLLVVLGIAALVAHGPFDLARRVAAHETKALGRPVTIGTLRVGLGASVTIELADLAIANTPGAGAEPFFKLGRLEAEAAPWSLVGWALLGHAPTLHHLSVADVALSLDHGADGRANWRFGTDKPAGNPRPGFPTLLDAQLSKGAVDVHTSSGKLLRITLDRVTIAAAGPDQPVTLTAIGAYNGSPITLDAPLGSFDQLHAAGTPFEAAVHMSSGETMLDFTGTMTKPLAADGVAGQLALKAPSPDRLLAIAGVGGHAAMAIVLAGGLTRDDALWKLSDAKGTLGAEPMQLTAQLREGPRHAPDAFTVDAGFAALDLSKIGGQDKSGETLLRIDDAPGTILDAHIAAKRITDGTLRADDVDLTATLAPGAFSLQPIAMRFAGGAARLDMSIKNAATGAAAAARIDGTLTGADPVQLARLLGLGALPLTGPVDLRAGFASTAVKASDAGANATGALVLSMQGGTIARNLIEQAATDVRSLFRTADGTAQVRCLLGVIDLKAGLGRMAPLKLGTSDGTLIGEGTLDLKRDTIDVTFATESATTSGFALDVPVRLAGPIHDPHVLPSVSRPSPGGDLGDLPPALQEFARGNPCATR
jgi:AsmA family protein